MGFVKDFFGPRTLHIRDDDGLHILTPGDTYHLTVSLEAPNGMAKLTVAYIWNGKTFCLKDHSLGTK